MRASEVLDLAVHAGVGPGVSVLDLCCGVAGPGRLVVRELGCDYLGVDADPQAVLVARERAVGLPCGFEVAEVPPVPSGPYDVVLLLETMLAFRDKVPLLDGVAAALRVGGRFAFTLEEGVPLTEAERALMPAADTVWPVPLPEMVAGLQRAGFRLTRQEDHSRAHRTIVDALVEGYGAQATVMAEQVGGRRVADLLASHTLWSDWLRSGRIRKFAFVAEKT
ncbi:MAG: class I SAM-dependent methyltransferase [Nocardioidaceae bacterium]|nr:class I SAM-dependent methyltransferase [Nocardioidaceae bacterium]NUS49801.1 class I SAM-dependent methyltransferase [Nocardioidaceae bacterium]